MYTHNQELIIKGLVECKTFQRVVLRTHKTLEQYRNTIDKTIDELSNAIIKEANSSYPSSLV